MFAQVPLVFPGRPLVPEADPFVTFFFQVRNQIRQLVFKTKVDTLMSVFISLVLSYFSLHSLSNSFAAFFRSL